jgi:acetyl esterase/lipase
MAKRYGLIVEDVEYGQADGVRLLARLYRPQGKGPFPGVVEVHGGAWTMNDRLTNRDIHLPLAESGVVVMAIDFRMPPLAQYPASLADINLAVRWLKANAGRLGVDASKVGLLGTSSGGHQAMLAAMRPDDPRYTAHPLADGGGVDASVGYVAMCWPVADPLGRYEMVLANGNERLVAAHHAYWPDKAAMDEGSPQRILERGEAVKLPPALLIVGTADDNLGPTMAARFAETYRAAGGRLQYEEFPGAPHAFIAKEPKADIARRAMRHIVDFVHGETG